ncbi:serine hydrolase domain-containing protein [Kribbella speibonae]|uniref:Class A beta-lactamase-related serine hydrolase n=1 Tax=Kribbella speibonae TaxID=1572660 RepID=A0A4R0ID07_9ACTN|nr:serine hydrolase domain-containing protein [Kribbella speibonae]TCC24553.1 class A beta-lactamase-related serine hydrolase [Kribbella speibonae]TCC31043.1 class A beta-lactamase-related serine hydrolase [Kribbella speibonae]
MWTAAGYEDVGEAFERNFTERGELGAAFAAYHRGELVVDLWGGTADPDTGRAWDRDTVHLMFSGTKGLTSACVLLLVQRGQVRLDDPVSRYWPEFGAEGKERTTIAEVLSHQARLAWVEAGYADLLDHDAMAAQLAAQAPASDPRTGFMYHAVTWGWLLDELVRRVDGRTVGQFFADEFAAPLGLEVWIGVPEDLHWRVATMVAPDGVLVDGPWTELNRPNPLWIPGSEKIWNSAEYRTAGLAAVGGYATARGMARFYASLLDADGVLAPETVALGRREIRRGTEPTWGSEIRYGAGYELQTGDGRMGDEADAFGHAGAGGSRHGAWPGRETAFSYLMNEVRVGPDARSLTLLEALSARSVQPR